MPKNKKTNVKRKFIQRDDDDDYDIVQVDDDTETKVKGIQMKNKPKRAKTDHVEDDDDKDKDDDEEEDDDKDDNEEDDDDDKTQRKGKGRKTIPKSKPKRGKTESEDNEEDADDKEDNEEIDTKETLYKCDKKSSNGKLPNLRITSWNVNGIRAWITKKGLQYIKDENADIVCFQETKCAESKLPSDIKSLKEYEHQYWLCPQDKEGYSGVALLSKIKPINVKYGIGIKEHDGEGRVITAEYPKFYLINAYVPNAGRGLTRLNYRMDWDKDFTRYLKSLDSKKPLILCGDLNVSHKEIDLTNPKTNTKTAGFTKEERDNFTALLNQGFVDSFRVLYPSTKNCYTFWSYMRNARAKNIGWRLDYYVLSKQLEQNICDNQIRAKVMGSDHCPIVLFIDV